jgi:hypothetical protein
VQAISAYTCQSVRTSWLVRSARESARAARTATHLAEVSARAADLQRDGARRALTNVSELLRAASERITTLVAEAAARSAAAEPAPVATETRVERAQPSRRRAQRDVRNVQRWCDAAVIGRLAVCHVPQNGLTPILHSSALRPSETAPLAGMQFFTRNLDDTGRAAVAQIITDNMPADQCRAPLIFYCRSADRIQAFVRRAGVCREANRSDETVTPESFAAMAREVCGDTPSIGVWAVPGHRILLRLTPEAIRGATRPVSSDQVSSLNNGSTDRLAQNASYDTNDPNRTEASPRGSPGNDTLEPQERFTCRLDIDRRRLAA